MAKIGTFKRTGDEFQGVIVTLSVQAQNVRIAPVSGQRAQNAPSHRVHVGLAEIGAAWAAQTSEGREYLSVKLDDPSFTGPIHARLLPDAEGETYTLIWSRS